ncbi:MAG: response regulator [Bacteriovorax sp.]|nr:response regulator [Bacteriovorax sp.]
MTEEKIKFFTTGQVADHCGVNFRTVIRWINKGYIKANRLPGRGDHRISLDDFISFLNENDFKSLSLEKNITPNLPKALIIDDEINAANSIGRIFTSNGFNVITAENGFKAGYLLNQEKPQILTLDLNMCDLNGYDVLKIIKGIKLNHKVWVIIISGDSEERLEKAIELGADLYLKKPFLKEDLEKIILKFYPKNNVGENNERSSIRRAS